MMQKLPQLVGVVMLGAVAACGHATGVQPENLAGVWTSTSLVYTSKADPSLSVNLADQGVIEIFQIFPEGVITVTRSGPAAGYYEGTIDVSGNMITITTSGDAVSGTIKRRGNTMTLDITNGPEYDFDGQGEQPATVLADFVRSG